MDATIKLIPVNGQWNISNGHVHLPKDSGAHVLTFDIVDNHTGKDITFGTDPLWIQTGSKPNAKPLPGSDMGQIGGWKVLDNGHQLVVVDWNDAATQLLYRLNFNGYVPTDPIIENGGGIKPSYTNYALLNYAGFAAVALIALFIGMAIERMWLAPRRMNSANTKGGVS